MAKVVNLNLNDTPISGAPTTTGFKAINFAADYVKSQNTPLSCLLTYNKAPYDAPQTVRFSSTPISNIYANTAVDPSYQLPYKRGQSLLAQLTQIATITDDADPTYRVDLPFESHLVFRCPQTSFLTDAQLYGIIQRAFCTLADSAMDPVNFFGSRIAMLLRGGMVPKGL